MGGRKKLDPVQPEPPAPVRPNINRAIVQGIGDMLLEHAEDIAKAQANTKDNAINIGFSAKIDCAGAQPTIKVSIRIPSTIKASRTAVLEDENQGGFEFLREVDGGGAGDQGDEEHGD